MKLKALALVLLAAGFGCSYALAGGKPSNHGHSNHGHSKLAVCHKAGKSGRWVKINVATKAAQKAHVKHGDVLPDASGNCPGSTTGTTTTAVTTTDETTTTDQTTTAETTTAETTTSETTTGEDSQGDDDNQGDDDGQGDNGDDDSQ